MGFSSTKLLTKPSVNESHEDPTLTKLDTLLKSLDKHIKSFTPPLFVSTGFIFASIAAGTASYFLLQGHLATLSCSVGGSIQETLVNYQSYLNDRSNIDQERRTASSRKQANSHSGQRPENS